MMKSQLTNNEFAAIKDLASELEVQTTRVLATIETNEIILFANSVNLKTFMKTQNTQENVDLYQLENGFYAVDLSLMGRKGSKNA